MSFYFVPVWALLVEVEKLATSCISIHMHELQLNHRFPENPSHTCGSLCETTSINYWVLNKLFSHTHTFSLTYTALKKTYTLDGQCQELQIIARGLCCTKGAPIPMGSISWSTACFQMQHAATFSAKDNFISYSVKLLLKQALNMPLQHQMICNKNLTSKTMSRLYQYYSCCWCPVWCR